jgi:aspartate/methionine/tyrosine aminotransferase
VAREPRISYVKPRSGTTALLRYESDLPSQSLCERLLGAEGVLFTPGSAMDMEGYLRVGYANNRVVLEEGLARTSAFLGTLAG